jgi:NADH-quinone oxidoreductase subunit A
MGFLLIEMLVFIAILLVGYVYVWKRGGFEWD